MKGLFMGLVLAGTLIMASSCGNTEPEEYRSDEDTKRTDLDGDGFTEEDDCDDTNSSVYPGATEIPDDGIDQDCDGTDEITPPPIGDGWTSGFWAYGPVSLYDGSLGAWLDVDGDIYVEREVPRGECWFFAGEGGSQTGLDEINDPAECYLQYGAAWCGYDCD